jgi:hypothetical protein
VLLFVLSGLAGTLVKAIVHELVPFILKLIAVLFITFVPSLVLRFPGSRVISAERLDQTRCLTERGRVQQNKTGSCSFPPPSPGTSRCRHLHQRLFVRAVGG